MGGGEANDLGFVSFMDWIERLGVWKLGKVIGSKILIERRWR